MIRQNRYNLPLVAQRERRRKFLATLGSAAVAWPLAVHGQQSAVPVVRFLGPALVTRQHWLTAFRRGLGTQGFIEGQNVTIECRSADGGAEELSELAAELIRPGRSDLRLGATRSTRG